MDSTHQTPRIKRRQSGMSYKFQRLREKIRQAVESGDLSGKLPGERELARRFHVNAKTLSKALTDLAAEGLLVRSIGRGTFVRGASVDEPTNAGPWLMIADRLSNPALIAQFKSLNPHAEVCDNSAALRPSYLNQFAAVIDLAAETPEFFLRDLLLRNIPIVAVGREPRSFSTHAVLLDSALGAAHLARQMLLAGHRRFVTIEARTQTAVAETIRGLAPSFGQDITADACFPGDTIAAIDNGATACICDSVRSATEVMRLLAHGQIPVPQRISVSAVGVAQDDFPCTGYYATPAQIAAAVAEILRAPGGRPTILWLTGKIVDLGTIEQPTFDAVVPDSDAKATVQTNPVMRISALTV